MLLRPLDVIPYWRWRYERGGKRETLTGSYKQQAIADLANRLVEFLLPMSHASGNEAKPHAEEKIGEYGPEYSRSDNRNILIAPDDEYDKQDDFDE